MGRVCGFKSGKRGDLGLWLARGLDLLRGLGGGSLRADGDGTIRATTVNVVPKLIELTDNFLPESAQIHPSDAFHVGGVVPVRL